MQATPLNALGWLFMTVSVTFVTLLALWCFKKVLSTRQQPPRPARNIRSA